MNVLSAFKRSKGRAEYKAADEASSSRSVIDLAPRACQVSFWAAVIATASYAPYFAALERYLAAGFSPPVPRMTPIVASVSVFTGAGAYVV